MGKDSQTPKHPIRNHRDLVAWQVAVDLGLKIYDLSTRWPKEELYGLTSQIRRASVSVAANIAEGNGRRTTKDYLRFLSNSYGSLMEVDTHLEFAHRRSYISDDQRSEVDALVVRCDKLLSGLRNSLEAKLKSPTSHPQPPTS